MPDRAALITGLILERPLCLDCVSTKGGMAVGEADIIIDQIGRVLTLHGGSGRCRACGETKLVFSVDRPAT